MSAKSPARPAGTGPPSSPRLPSPPPLPELQLGPRSPSINATGGELNLEDAAAQDEGAERRIRPGTSAVDMARGPPFVPLHQLESPFQLQEYLKSSYCNATRDESCNTIKPITKESAMQLATPPIQQDTGDPVDRNLWLYELCRFLVQRTNRLIVSFFADNPPCSSQTCPEMRASEWQYLCAVHEPPKSCCAIDYCCHTLDWAANVLTSPKHFPSRLSLGGEGGSAYQSMRQLTNIFRRVYRIYAHAWFQHREAFWSLEQEEGLYKFFRTVCDVYSLIPEDNYTIPSEAEADREESSDTPISRRVLDIQMLAGVQSAQRQQQPPSPPSQLADPEPASVASLSAMGPTVRRHGHRHTPSTGTHVTMIAEGTEEEEEEGTSTMIPQAPQVLSESITQLSQSPSKAQMIDIPPRSPRPNISIPIDDTNVDFRPPHDPTPTPESHKLDPFSESTSVQADQTAVDAEESPAYNESDHAGTEPVATSDLAAALAATSLSKGEEIPTSKTPVPPLKTQIQPRVVDEEQEVRSPGGGSIRTIGGDILSGILAHVHSDNNGAPEETEMGNHNSDTRSPDSSWNVAEQKIESEGGIQTKNHQDSALAPDTTAETMANAAEPLEQMEDIKSVETSTGINPKDETTMQTEPENATDTKDKAAESKDDNDKGEKTRDDGTKPEDTPSGVV